MHPFASQIELWRLSECAWAKDMPTISSRLGPVDWDLLVRIARIARGPRAPLFGCRFREGFGRLPILLGTRANAKYREEEVICLVSSLSQIGAMVVFRDCFVN